MLLADVDVAALKTEAFRSEFRYEVVKIGGIIIGLLGAILFAAHFVLAEFYPEQNGYFSHQIRAVDGAIVAAFGMAVYFIGFWRVKRKSRPDVRSKGQ